MKKPKHPKINRIAEILEQKKMTQVEFGEIWGKTFGHVSKICRNENQPRVSDFPLLSKILDVKMDELIVSKKAK